MWGLESGSGRHDANAILALEARWTVRGITTQGIENALPILTDVPCCAVRILLAGCRNERELDDRGGKGLGGGRSGVLEFAEVRATVVGSIIAIVTGFERSIEDGISTAGEGTIGAAEGVRSIGVAQAIITLFSGIHPGVAAVVGEEGDFDSGTAEAIEAALLWTAIDVGETGEMTGSFIAMESAGAVAVIHAGGQLLKSEWGGKYGGGL